MIFLYTIFVLICVLLTVSVLLQSGKGGGLAGTFGGSSQYLGGRGTATFLTKATTTLAAIFMLMAILLSTLGGRTYSSGEQQQTEAQRQMQQTAPAQVAPLPNQEQ
jgi:preprotein translocase subunit SecG